MKKKTIYMLIALLACVLQVQAQERVITGVVLDGDLKDEPLIGATVGKGVGKVSTGTVTDYEGKFKLSVDKDTKALSVSYVGYTTQTISLKPGVNHYKILLMPDAHSINEVVVTGYQRIDRRKLTASVTTVDISDKAVGAVKNIDQALAGQIAGLSTVSSSGAPGAPVKIRIRGTASINGTQEPLWVLDGIPLEGTDIPSMEDLNDIDDMYQTSIAGINPSDIENITVLKDAAATAIYGARAANGVIVITTKKGKEGRPVINFSAKYTYSPKLNIDRLNLLNADEKVDLELGLLASDYTYREHKGEVANILKTLNETEAYKKGGWKALSASAQTQIDALRNIHTDWNDILFRHAMNQEYNASIAGGSNRSGYYTSVGYYDEQGNVKGVDNKRFNMTLKADYRINKMLKLGASVYANQRKQNSYLTDTNGFTNPVYYSRLANPYFLPFVEGKYHYDVNVQGKEDSSLDFNIFEERENTSHKRTDRSLMAIFDGELQFTPDLKLTSQFGLQYDNYSLEKYAGENSFAMRKEHFNAIYAYKDGKRSYLPEGGMHKTTSYNSLQWTWKALLEYARRFNKVHDVELLAGTEVRHINSSSVYSAAYGYDARTLTTHPVIFPNETTAESRPLHRENQAENAYVSWFATGSYTLFYRYTLGGSVRFDGSDVFGVAKKYRYLPLYSVSGLWRVHQERFAKKAKWLSNLALRASYGIQGNIDKNTSPYLIGFYDKTSILPGKGEQMIKAETAPNPDLRWEKTKNVNFGVDLGLWNNAITLSADYYYRRSSDLIGMRMLPQETGFSATTINWASMENSGWEIALGSRNIYTRNFKWTTNLNLGFNTNKILNESVAENSTYPSREGYPVGALFAYKTAGLDKDGYPLFVNKEGNKVTAAELLKLNNAGASTLSASEQRALYTYMGTTDPKVSGGFINHFEYKDWQLGINFIFNLGMKVRVQPSYNPTTYDRGLNVNRDILQRWTPTNSQTTFPKLMTKDGRVPEHIQYSEYNTYSMLDTWVKDRSYMRLQSLRLGYKLPSKWLNKVGVTNASLSLEGRNLFVVATDYTNYLDPETMGNPFAQPMAKSVIFGLNMNF